MRPLLRLQLKTGWKSLAGWPLSWTFLVFALAASTISLYPGREERERYAASIGASGMQEVFNGRGYELRTAGGILSFEMGMFALLALSLGACLMIVNRTRGEEAEGRWDLVTAASRGGAAVTRSAAIAAALAILAFAVVASASLIALGFPTRGSIVYSLSLACYAATFAAFGLLLAQIAPDARAAATAAVTTILVCYLLRAVVDGRGWRATWATPMGWLAEARPWGETRWWPFPAFAMATTVFAGVALAIASRRDLGGSLGTRPGPVRVTKRLSGPWMWTWRMARAGSLAWLVGVIALASVMAAMSEEMRGDMAANPSLASIMGGQDPADFLTMLTMVLIALVSLAAGVGVWMRCRTEELSGRLGLVASAPIRRDGPWTAWLVSSVLASSTVMIAGTLVYGVVLLRVSRGTDLGTIARSGIAGLAAVTILVVLAGVLLAFRPGLGWVAWIPCAWTGIVGILADSLRLPDWSRQLSPLWAVGRVPVDSPRWGVVAAFALAAVFLAAVGRRLSGQRDLAAG